MTTLQDGSQYLMRSIYNHCNHDGVHVLIVNDVFLVNILKMEKLDVPATLYGTIPIMRRWELGTQNLKMGNLAVYHPLQAEAPYWLEGAFCFQC